MMFGNNEIDENSINIFHAMKCRKIYYELIRRNMICQK